MLRDSEYPLALAALTERLNFHHSGPITTGGFQTFNVDLSEWSLSLTHATPCIWVKEMDLLAHPPAQLMLSLRDVAREREWHNAIILLFVDGAADALRPHVPPTTPKFVFIEREEQRLIAQADSPSRLMLDILMRQVPRAQLAPYESSRPVFGSRFFGRDTEINRIKNHPDRSYVVTGLRRVGKTSLLKEVMRRMDEADPVDGKQTRRFYLNCAVIDSEEEFYRALAGGLDPLHQKELMREVGKATRYRKLMFDRFYSLHGGTITIFLDEIDRLLTRAGDQSTLMDVMRSASSDETAAGHPKVRFILSGFRLAMHTSNSRDSAWDFAEAIQLGPLMRNDVTRMIVGPLGGLRITIENQAGVVRRIHRETAGLPHNIQLYCRALLELLDSEQRDILTEDDLKYVYESETFQDYILESFRQEMRPEEKAIVYALIAEPGDLTSQQLYTQRIMDDYLKKRGLSLKGDVLDNCCRNLTSAGVFNRVGTNYEFAVPIFQQILRETRDVELLLEKSIGEVDINAMIV